MSESENRDRDRLMQVCQELAATFAERAPKYDREGTFPVENFQDLKDNGLLGIMVPVEHGGWGADFLTYTKAIETLAVGDAATALAFNMHNITVGSLAEVPETDAADKRSSAVNDFRDWVYEEVIQNKKLFASATSEPGIGAHISHLKTSYEKTDEGFIINGAKSFVSMAGYADYYVVAAKAARSKSAQAAVSFLIVDRDAEGVVMKNIWDVLGMRSTSTNPITFTDVKVPRDRLFLASEGLALYKIAREPHWLVGGYIGVYLGILTATFDFLTDYMSKKNKPGTETPLSEDALIQYQTGKLYSDITSARLATYHAARLVDSARGSDDANAAIHHAKYLVGETGPTLASAAIRMCGATTIAKRLPLERFYRESRCGGLMPAHSDDCLGYLGKAAYGTNLKNPIATYW